MTRNYLIKSAALKLCIVGIIGGLLIFFVDFNRSKLVDFERDISGHAEEAQMERECVKVKLSQLNEFITVLRARSRPFSNFKNAKYDEKEKKTIIGFDGAFSSTAKEILFGAQDVSTRWEYYYNNKEGVVICFDTEFAENDTIIHVPAFTLAKIVEAYENAL